MTGIGCRLSGTGRARRKSTTANAFGGVMNTHEDDAALEMLALPSGLMMTESSG